MTPARRTSEYAFRVTPIDTGSRLEPPTPLRAHGEWMLDPAVVFLNHGCFGARLRSVFAEQQQWRERFERQPIVLLERERDEHLQRAKVTAPACVNIDDSSRRAAGNGVRRRDSSMRRERS